MRVTIDDPALVRMLRRMAADEGDARSGVKTVVERLLQQALAEIVRDRGRARADRATR